MRAILFVSALVLPIMLAGASKAAPAMYPGSGALSAIDHVATVKDKFKWKAGGCKYEYKANARGFQEKYKCK
jgi:hypothetical protein